MTVKRPMLWICASFLMGMYLFAVMGPAVAFAVIFCALIVLFIRFKRKTDIFTNTILAISVLTLLLGVVRYETTDNISLHKLYAANGKQVILTGEVTQEPVAGERYIRFIMQVTSFEDNGSVVDNVNEKITVTLFFPEGITQPPVDLQRGNIVTVNCAVALPDSAKNSSGFDYANYLKTKNIFFQATVKDSEISVIGKKTPGFMDYVADFRDKCFSLIDNTFPQPESGVIRAYVMGDTTEISDETSLLFSASGLSHILAVSGSHITVFLTALIAFLKLVRLSKRKQWLISIIAVVFFVLFTGASAAAIRAGFVCVVAIAAQLVSARSDPLTSLAEAGAMICLIQPHAILDASFMLSFGATLGILLFSDKIDENLSFLPRRLKPNTKCYRLCKVCCSLLAMGVASNLVIIPILVSLFDVFSLMSVISTVVINPILTPMLAAGLLFVFVGLLLPVASGLFSGFLFLSAKFMLWIATFFAELPFSTVSFGMQSYFVFLLYLSFCAVLLFLCVYKNRLGYLISLYTLLSLFAIGAFYTVKTVDEVSVTFINVGQGDCTYINAPGNCDILIDGGGTKDSTTIADYVVKPYLMHHGVRDLEYVIASHDHNDHINGLIGLMDTYEIKNIIVPVTFGTSDEGKRFLEKASEKQIPVYYFKRGYVLKITDEISFTALMPDDTYATFTKDKEENEHSLLLRFTCGDTSFLFTGDLTEQAERYALMLEKETLRADVLKVAHHGSNSSNPTEFLETVSPEYAFIPVGNNAYGHPKPETLQRLYDLNVSVYRADRQRDVTFYIDASGVNGIYYE